MIPKMIFGGNTGLTQKDLEALRNRNLTAIGNHETPSYASGISDIGSAIASIIYNNKLKDAKQQNDLLREKSIKDSGNFLNQFNNPMEENTPLEQEAQYTPSRIDSYALPDIEQETPQQPVRTQETNNNNLFSDKNLLMKALVQTESGGNPDAVSPVGAEGVTQVMPETQKDPGFGVTPMRDKSTEEFMRVGEEYLGAMQKRYDNTEDALRAYNWGPGNMDKWIAGGRNPNEMPKETQDYVGKIQNNYQKIAGAVQRETVTPVQQEPMQVAQNEATPMPIASDAPAGNTTYMPQNEIKKPTFNFAKANELLSNPNLPDGTKALLSKIVERQLNNVMPDNLTNLKIEQVRGNIKGQELQNEAIKLQGQVMQAKTASEAKMLEQKILDNQQKMNMEQAKTESVIGKNNSYAQYYEQRAKNRPIEKFNQPMTVTDKNGNAVLVQTGDKGTIKPVNDYNPINPTDKTYNETKGKDRAGLEKSITEQETGLPVLEYKIKELKKLNDTASSTAMQNLYDSGAGVFGINTKGSDAKKQMQALLSDITLESLRSTFGGNPTEGERGVLTQTILDINASPQARMDALNRYHGLSKKKLQADKTTYGSLYGVKSNDTMKSQNANNNDRLGVRW